MSEMIFFKSYEALSECLIALYKGRGNYRVNPDDVTVWNIENLHAIQVPQELSIEKKLTLVETIERLELPVLIRRDYSILDLANEWADKQEPTT